MIKRIYKFWTSKHDCSYCWGSGWWENGEIEPDTCGFCNGTGRQGAWETFKVICSNKWRKFKQENRNARI